MSEAAAANVVAALGSRQFPDCFLALAENAITHDAAALMLFRQNGPPRVLVDRLLPAERSVLHDDYLAGVYLLSPFYRAAQGLGHPLVARVKEIAPEGFTASEYYRRYFSRIGVADMLGVLLPCDGGVLFVSLSRSRGKRRFSPDDGRRLSALLPLFTACLAQHAALGGRLADIAPAAIAPSTPRRPDTTALTPRESEVVTLILEGHSSRSLAARLSISAETVRVHRRHIYAKLKISSQAELFRWFLGGHGA